MWQLMTLDNGSRQARMCGSMRQPSCALKLGQCVCQLLALDYQCRHTHGSSTARRPGPCPEGDSISTHLQLLQGRSLAAA